MRDNKVSSVIGLLDVYPNFGSAKEVKEFMRKASGYDERFYAHAAQYDVEAWLLPYWEFICHRIGVKRARLGRNPEQVNNMAPPSKRLGALYQIAKRKYKKPIEMNVILERQDLSIAARECRELRLLLNTLLRLGGLTLL